MTAPINSPKNHYKWGDHNGHVLYMTIAKSIYMTFVYWKKKLFMLPTG